MALITTIEVLVSILLTIAILLQHRSAGLTATFGGGGATYVQRRGAEKVLYQASIWLSILFLSLAVLQWYL
ncbi:MAG: preprotein translocase subunit SecG [Candidatus Peregrinibacteria bacterium]